MSPGLRPLELALRSALRMAAARLDGGPGAPLVRAGRHPLTPAAIRVERTRSRSSRSRSDQTAVTMWFGSGPSLPVPSIAGPALRATVRLGAGLLGAAAMAAASTLAAQRAQERLAAPPPVRALRPPDGAGP